MLSTPRWRPGLHAQSRVPRLNRRVARQTAPNGTAHPPSQQPGASGCGMGTARTEVDPCDARSTRMAWAHRRQGCPRRDRRLRERHRSGRPRSETQRGTNRLASGSGWRGRLATRIEDGRGWRRLESEVPARPDPESRRHQRLGSPPRYLPRPAARANGGGVSDRAERRARDGSRAHSQDRIVPRLSETDTWFL